MGEYRQRLLDKLRRDLGQALVGALEDPATVEILLNPDGRLWLESLGEPMRCIGRMDPARGEAVVKTLASHLGEGVTQTSPLIEGELPIASGRFAGQLPPVVPAPTFAIRRPAVADVTLEDYLAQGALSRRHFEALERAIAEHENVLVVGGTGSGKTTFINALIAKMTEQAPEERLVVLEDTREIRCKAENAVQYRVCPGVTMTQLLRTTLRMRPDRILLGEVRGPEALDLLMAWNTGHEGGAATVHANDARAGLLRLSMLVSMHPDAPSPIEPLVAEAVDLVVHLERRGGARRITELVQVSGHDPAGFQTQTL